MKPPQKPEKVLIAVVLLGVCLSIAAAAWAARGYWEKKNRNSRWKSVSSEFMSITNIGAIITYKATGVDDTWILTEKGWARIEKGTAE